VWQAIVDGAMPGFWPPRPARAWNVLFGPFRRWYLHRYYGVADVEIEGAEHLTDQIGPADGVLIAPNHSHDSDPHVMMEVSKRLGRQFYFMAAWQLFRAHWGIDGWLLQRLGAFSVDREGCDRRAIKQAVQLLTTGQRLVVFPEGEVYRLNDRLTPLLEGVAFMALTAQRDLEKREPENVGESLRDSHSHLGETRPHGTPGRVWIVPAAIRYRYVDDVRPQLEAAVAGIEQWLLWNPPAGAALHERIIRVGELLLTIKEKEHLGVSRDSAGDLPSRVAFLIEALLERHEHEHLKQSPSAETVPLRIKALRRTLLDHWMDENAGEAVRRQARAALDDVQLVLQLYSYPGDYIKELPSIERMAETIEKFEEDLTGAARPKGKRHARVLLGQPIDLKQAAAGGRPRAVAADVTSQLERAIQGLMAGAPASI
jgi:1-acyl-sn-glycerol-3-phosphate acyltransferase